MDSSSQEKTTEKKKLQIVTVCEKDWTWKLFKSYTRKDRIGEIDKKTHTQEQNEGKEEPDIKEGGLFGG